jgi:hypothetical protein
MVAKRGLRGSICYSARIGPNWTEALFVGRQKMLCVYPEMEIGRLIPSDKSDIRKLRIKVYLARGRGITRFVASRRISTGNR